MHSQKIHSQEYTIKKYTNTHTHSIFYFGEMTHCTEMVKVNGNSKVWRTDWHGYWVGARDTCVSKKGANLYLEQSPCDGREGHWQCWGMQLLICRPGNWELEEVVPPQLEWPYVPEGCKKCTQLSSFFYPSSWPSIRSCLIATLKEMLGRWVWVEAISALKQHLNLSNGNCSKARRLTGLQLLSKGSLAKPQRRFWAV